MNRTPAFVRYRTGKRLLFFAPRLFKPTLRHELMSIFIRLFGDGAISPKAVARPNGRTP